MPATPASDVLDFSDISMSVGLPNLRQSDAHATAYCCSRAPTPWQVLDTGSPGNRAPSRTRDTGGADTCPAHVVWLATRDRSVDPATTLDDVIVVRLARSVPVLVPSGMPLRADLGAQPRCAGIVFGSCLVRSPGFGGDAIAAPPVQITFRSAGRTVSVCALKLVVIVIQQRNHLRRSCVDPVGD